MPKREREAQYRRYLDSELEAAATYGALADAEKDPGRAAIFRRLAEWEMRHAAYWAEKLGIDPAGLKPVAGRGFRLQLLKRAARVLGTSRLVPMLLRGEARDLAAYAADPEARDLAKEERRHSRTLRRLAGTEDPLAVVRAESRHQASGNGSLRAAVLGVNDGLVSNFSLVMGVAGGTGSPKFVLLAGVAGLLAGAFSMAAGEYISMRSQRDIYERQIQLEQAEIERWPEEEVEELVLLYQAKGLSQEEAERIARQVMADPVVALDTMAREELGLDPSGLGSPWGAASSSFAAFVAGAIVPISPYLFGAGRLAFSLSGVLSAAALLGVGGFLAWMAGRSAAWGALRMLIAGGAAAAVTYSVGRLIGGAIAG
ncbi:MAG: VIT1/CCC1 transporter family protein [Chloroflexi bacterium]|nr:VIT1/CCC1 transporter family protein [Chloroflexota bacterium]